MGHSLCIADQHVCADVARLEVGHMAAPLKGALNVMFLLNRPQYGTQESLAMYIALATLGMFSTLCLTLAIPEIVSVSTLADQ